jgi:phosphoribosyl-ATP pyrophosphohydrolase/phosphoribosyl-AMP cyclohydrolase
MNHDDMRILFDKQGLVPALVQDAASGQVLMVAWMNEEALRLTQETGQAHFWSRSRRELWHKGATSGNVMNVLEIWVDCDADTLLLQVDPAGPACHTGNPSCFFRRLGQSGEPSVRRDADGGHVLHTLFATILDRRSDPRPGSYTAHLLDAGEDEILRKVHEEAMEVILAAKGEGDARVISEVADLFYHLLVLLAARGLTLADVETELVRRRR